MNFGTKIFTAICISWISGAMAFADRGDHHDRRGHDDRRGSHQRDNTCVAQAGSPNYFGYFKNNANQEYGEYKMVVDGAELEVLSYEAVYYKGQRYDGVKFRVISNPVQSYRSDYAQPGDILWEYANIFECY